MSLMHRAQEGVQAAMMVAALMLPTAAASAAGFPELFRDAAAAGTLEGDDLVTLAEEHDPACFLWSSKARQLFCVSAMRTASTEVWRAVFVDIPSGAIDATQVVQQVDGELQADVSALTAVNAQLSASRWKPVFPTLDALLPASGPVEARGADGSAVSFAEGVVQVSLAGALSGRLSVPLAAPWTSAQVLVYVPQPAQAALVMVDRGGKPGSEVSIAVLHLRGTMAKRVSPVPSLTPHARAGCPRDAGCPPNYPLVYPLLQAFCAEGLDDALLAGAGGALERGTLSADDLALLFNAYGAMYGYRFKKKVAYNRFFYGDGSEGAARPWLPDACRDAFPRAKSAAGLPRKLRGARDALKALWRQYK